MKNYLNYGFLFTVVFVPLLISSTVFEWYLLSMCLSALLFIFIGENKNKLYLKAVKTAVLIFWFLFAGAVSFSVAVGSAPHGNNIFGNSFLYLFGILQKSVVSNYDHLPSIISRINATQQH